MTDEMVNLCALVEAPDADLLRDMIGFVTELLTELSLKGDRRTPTGRRTRTGLHNSRAVTEPRHGEGKQPLFAQRPKSERPGRDAVSTYNRGRVAGLADISFIAQVVFSRCASSRKYREFSQRRPAPFFLGRFSQIAPTIASLNHEKLLLRLFLCMAR
jgi:hypothetical protein